MPLHQPSRTPGRESAAAPTWSRRKLTAVALGALGLAAALVLGLALAVYYTLRPTPHPSSQAGGGPPATGASGSAAAGGSQAVASPAQQTHAAENRIATQPMPHVGLDAAKPGPVSTRDPGAITLPAPTRTGPAGVPTGFPHTPTGALAQLAALDQTALDTASLPGVRAVIASWAAPGGPTPTSWSGVAAMGEFLDSADLSGGGDVHLALVATPLMGLIKGSVGTDFTVACVDFEVDATLTVTQRVAVADCQRMTWHDTDGRWVIGPGPEPAPAPSVWPDTDAAVSVGYRDLRHA